MREQSPGGPTKSGRRNARKTLPARVASAGPRLPRSDRVARRLLSSLTASEQSGRLCIVGLAPERSSASYQLFFQMVHPQDRARLDRAFGKAIRSGSDFQGEFRIVRPDGAVTRVRGRAYPVPGDDGEIMEYVVTVEAIRLQLRPRPVVQLESQNGTSQRARAGIGPAQLMAWIAHEVNQPIAALIVNASAALRWLARDPPKIDKTRQALLRIVKDGNRASDIIARIRALVRNVDAERKPLNLNSLIRDVLALLKQDLQRYNVVVRIETTEDLPRILGDRVQIRQVLLNLVMNSIEAMSTVAKRTRLLTLSTFTESESVIASVSDRGIGLAEHALKRLFEPFYTTKPQGMGIGLTISRSIIEAHGGRLWAQKNHGSGATFRFRLPANGAEAG